MITSTPRPTAPARNNSPFVWLNTSCFEVLIALTSVSYHYLIPVSGTRPEALYAFKSRGFGGMLLNGGTNDQHVGIVLRHTGSFISLLFGLALSNLYGID